MRKLTLVAAVSSLWACSPEVLAALHERTEEGINELSHSVKVRFEDGAALLTVSRRLRNDTAEYQELTRHLTLPDGAVATSLRVSTDGAWPVQSTLTTSEQAADRWDALTGPGDGAPSTLAMLEWSWEGGLELELFGLAPGSIVNVEYDLELPPDYAAGELSFEYPRDEQLAPDFQLTSGSLEHVAQSTEADDTSSGYRLRRASHPREVFDARWATYPLAVDRSLWRLEVDVAAQLEKAPVRPNVVFVVDASHSEGADGIAGQLELIAPYLVNAGDAQVEVVLYRRFAERLFGRFVPASDVARLLASTPAERLSPGNGSNLELGAALAAEALAQTAGTGRVVLFTDELMRFGFSNDLAIQALASVPRDTVVHLVARHWRSTSALSEERDDTAELSPVAAAYGGIFLRVNGQPLDPVLSADTLLGLIRPIRIDSFAVEAAGLEDDEELRPNDTLPEGSTIRLGTISASPPSEITVTGKLWARELRRVVSLDRSLSNRLPGFAIGDDLIRGQLSDEELSTVAFVSHAVSPVTSYFAAAPEASPSTAGAFKGLSGLGTSGGFSTCGCGSSSTCGGFGRSGKDTIDYAGLLRALLAPGVAACEQTHGDASAASVRLEATGDEVVGVAVSAPSDGLAECLTEAAWAIRLSAPFVAHRLYDFTISDQ